MEPCRGFLHVVEDGDTLYWLSKRYEVPLSSILLANPYVNVYNLQKGDEICIPRPRCPRWFDCR
ncbi:MAG: LysM peptidoglycan-binding domain-containing protein [Lachnospiraceae bacterium]|nr:LysM peptidoglycan-binding domain-containing protein [Lachnospiraceae bacterium]